MIAEPFFFPEDDGGNAVERIEVSLEEFSGLFYLDFYLGEDGRLTLCISYPDVVHLIGVLLALANRLNAIKPAKEEPRTPDGAESSSVITVRESAAGHNMSRLSRYLRLAMLIYSRLQVDGEGDDKRVFEICLTNASRLAGNTEDVLLCD